MKKFKKQKTTNVALFAGATALIVLAPNIRAQSSDALIDKLEQKGILTVDEARELRAESQQGFNNNFTNSFGKAFDKITGTPDWVTGYKFSGDFRGRFDKMTTDNDGGFHVGAQDRDRFRYRIRMGLTVSMFDNIEAGFRLGSGDNSSTSGTGNPLSNNTTLENDSTKKPVWIDTAYGKWTALNTAQWFLSTTVGKMDNPFLFTPMIFDPDLTPEGAALQGAYNFNSQQSLTWTAAAFVLDEEKTSSHDPFMYGGQLLWNAKWTPKLSTSAGLGAFSLVNRDTLTPLNVPNGNQGNTRVTGIEPTDPSQTVFTSLLKYNYNPVIADANVTYLLDTFPFYAGKFPIKLSGEFINNPGAPRDNDGYWAGVTFGKSGAKHTWDVSYRYEYLEADAWYDQLVDDDNIAFYVNAPLGGTTGFVGGTNVKGHLVKFNYSFTDSLTFTATCFINSLINRSVSGFAEPNNSSLHFMADLMWKF